MNMNKKINSMILAIFDYKHLLVSQAECWEMDKNIKIMQPKLIISIEDQI